MAATAERVILASASAARAAVLRAACVDFHVEPAAVDETRLKRLARQAGDSAIQCAMVLAAEKACCVSRRHPAALVIGADQILAAGTEWFDKPADLAEASAQLLMLRGRTHSLATAVCAARSGTPLWGATSTPELTMRRFSDGFLAEYIAAEGCR
jgi:septum formation protein